MHFSIAAAFAATSRENFLPPDIAGQARMDIPLPIGFSQTNSQPSTVAMMLDWLEVQPSQKILDVGAGSGWTTALLSRLTGAEGQVVAVEKVPELVRFGRDNVARLDILNAEFYQAGKQYGWPAGAPYDRILVSAAASYIPQELVDQLAYEGTLVIPIKHSILVIKKDAMGTLEQTEHSGFVFVPLLPAMLQSDD